MAKKVRLKGSHTHSRYCRLKNKPAFYFFSERKAFEGSIVGNENNTLYTWLEFVCSDPKCEAIAIVRLEYLAEWIHQELKKQ